MSVNRPIQDLAEVSSLSDSDILYVKADPAGTPLDRKGPMGKLWTYVLTKIASAAAVVFGNTSLKILDTDASHVLTLAPGSDLTDDRQLTIATGDASRTITVSGNPMLNDWFDQSVKAAASPAFAGATVNGNLQVTRTTEQVRVRYDASNYFSATVGSTGTVTLDAVGSGAAFVFADTVQASGYQSSDGSAGLTQDVTVRNAAGDGTTVLRFKNGLLTAVDP